MNYNSYKDILLREFNNICTVNNVDFKFSYNRITMIWKFNLEKAGKKKEFIIEDRDMDNKPSTNIIDRFICNMSEIL